MSDTETINLDLRCRKCDKLLARTPKSSYSVEIKCRKCGTLNSYLESAKEQIVITDREGVILFANDSLLELTGFGSEEIIGQTPKIWGNQMGDDFYQKMWQTIKEDKKTFITNIINRKKNGEQYKAKLRISPVLNIQGEIELFVGIETIFV